MSVGETIKKHRKSAQMTLDELSRMSGVPKSTIQRWESGAIQNMGQANLKKVAEALGTTVNGLQDGAPPAVTINEKKFNPYAVFTILARENGYLRLLTRDKNDLVYQCGDRAICVGDEDIQRIVSETVHYFGFLMHRQSVPLQSVFDRLEDALIQPDPEEGM